MLDNRELEKVCESCGMPEQIVCEVPMRRGRSRFVCVYCLGKAIQLGTGWKMLSMVHRMVEARAMAPMQREAARRIREQFYADEVAPDGD